MKSSSHRLIPFLPLFCNFWLNSIPLLPSSYPDRRAFRNSTQFFSNELFFITMQKTQPLYCWEGEFIAPLHSNGSYSIVVCVFVAAGMCLPSRCLAMNVYSDFTTPAFGRHVTIFSRIYTSFYTRLEVLTRSNTHIGIYHNLFLYAVRMLM
jgi:hypothetical protein